MWIVAKIKPKQQSIFIDSINRSLKDKTEIYFPRIVVKNDKKEKIANLLGTYIFCFNKSFNSEKILKAFQYIKGLNYFLTNSLSNQKDLNKFINSCKSFENSKGILDSSFFLNFSSKNFKFTDGPLKNLLFKILDVNKNKIFAEIGNNKKVTINNKRENCYHFLNN
jgi:hypothetical protein